MVWDRGIEGSDRVVRQLSQQHDWARAIWLSRNFGQHAATLAGMTSSGGEWIVTMDEDGQHDPAYIGQMLDTAYRSSCMPRPPPRRPRVPPERSLTVDEMAVRARARVRIAQGVQQLPVDPRRGRTVGRGVHRPGCVSRCRVVVGRGRVGALPGRHADEGRASGSYTYRRLGSHFWRLVVSSGTRPLRIRPPGPGSPALRRLVSSSPCTASFAASRATSRCVAGRRCSSRCSSSVAPSCSRSGSSPSTSRRRRTCRWASRSTSSCVTRPRCTTSPRASDAPMLTWVVGSGGLLGGAVTRAEFTMFEGTTVPWMDDTRRLRSQC